jgi:transketolase
MNDEALTDRVSAKSETRECHSGVTSKRIRRIVLEQAKRAGVGHIGSALSVVDIIAALYGQVLRISAPEDPERDRFVLSKGHAALTLYAALHLRGWLSQVDLNKYCGNNTLVGVHPEHTLRGVDFATGSLGQGLSMAAGAALAGRFQGSARRAFVLVSDAECNEGSQWEAVMFAAHHKLANLIAIVDLNGQQALGYTQSVLSLSPLASRWRAFGWDVHEVDGHNVTALTRTMEALTTNSGPPHVLLAQTVFGHGVSYMESQIKWHYWPMSEADYERALSDTERLE